MKKRIITGLVALTSMVSSAAAQDIYRTAANVPMVQLNNGILMPQFGLGTFFQPSDSVCEQSCLTALKASYRHIDTAHAYNDEAGVGRAVKESGIPREEIWVTSKLWPKDRKLTEKAKWASRGNMDHQQSLADRIRGKKDIEGDRRDAGRASIGLH